MSRIHAALFLSMFCLLYVCVGCDSGAGLSAQIDPRANQALKDMSDTLGNAKAFSFHAEGVMDEETENGQLVQFSRESRIVAHRPNKLFADTKGDDVSRSVWYDGRKLTLLDKADNVYASTEVPSDIESMVDFIIEKHGLTLPLADLLFTNSYESLIANVQSGEYLGLHTANGHACHHLGFRQELIDWQIWIDAGNTPVPRKLVITYTQEPGHPHFSATLDDWNLSASISEGAFEFHPPADAKRLEMAELLDVDEGE